MHWSFCWVDGFWGGLLGLRQQNKNSGKETLVSNLLSVPKFGTTVPNCTEL